MGSLGTIVFMFGNNSPSVRVVDLVYSKNSKYLRMKV